MQAIITKYLSPTENRGSRIKAKCDAGSITIPYPHEYSTERAHAEAAIALRNKLGWTYDMVAGSLPDGAGNYGYAFVMIEKGLTPESY